MGLGKTHLAASPGCAACLKSRSVLFSTAVDAVKTLWAPQQHGTSKNQSAKYLRPRLLILDEPGYLPMDKAGAGLPFQVVSHRYKRGSIIVTSNRAFKQWPKIFNNGSTLTSAVLDRLLHHADAVVVEGDSYRMKERMEAEWMIGLDQCEYIRTAHRV